MMRDTLWAARVMVMPGALMARMAGCAFWVARYSFRDDVHEWDVDWSLCPKKGMTELRLVCPNNRVLVLSTAKGAPFFQFKIGSVDTGGDRRLLGHLIGRMDGPDGECTIHAWEPAYEYSTLEQYQTAAEDGSGGIVWKERLIRHTISGKTVENIKDNFYNLQYQNLGKMNAEVLL